MRRWLQKRREAGKRHWTSKITLQELLSYPPLQRALLVWLGVVLLYAVGAISEVTARIMTSVAGAGVIVAFITFLRQRVPRKDSADLERWIRRWWISRIVVVAATVLLVLVLTYVVEWPFGSRRVGRPHAPLRQTP